MLRSSRVTASLIRSLLLGSAAVVATVATSTVLVGCKDESQPEYWTEKLEDPQWRPRAVKRLEQFFEDSLTRSNKDLNSPEVQELLNKIVEPLTNAYVQYYDQMDTKTRVSLIKLLASTRDKRTEPALKKAFEEYAKRPRSTKDEQDIKWAAIAAADLKLPSLAGPMLDAFQKFRASTMLGGIAYRDVNEAMVAVADKAWAGPLKTMLQAEMSPPRDAKDKDKIDPYRDQQLWQLTAAQVLGRIGDPSGVEPLLRVMLDPAKADVQNDAILALVKLGKPAVDETVKLLKGQNTDLVGFASRRIKEVSGTEPKDNPHVRTAALILGTIGRAEAIAPMIEVLNSTTDESNKAIIARELTKLPATPDSKEAFKKAFESISLDTVVPPGLNAQHVLAEAAARFYDPELVDWLIEREGAVKGGGEDAKALQTIITSTVLKLAKPDQLPKVKALVDRHGTQIEKDWYAQTEALMKACGDRVSCYLAAIEKSENQDKKTQFTAIKAGYMLGILGNEQTRADLIDRLGSLTNGEVRFVAAQTIDQLSPKGSKESAEKLRKIIDKNAKSPDRDKAMADAPLKQVMFRLEARAG